MKMRDAVTAYGALSKIAGEEMEFRDAYEVAKVLEKLKNAVEFHGREEMRLAEKYAEKVDGKPHIAEGNIYFASGEDREAFYAKREELGNIEIEDVRITIKPMKGAVKPEVLVGLMDVVEFREDENAAEDDVC